MKGRTKKVTSHTVSSGITRGQLFVILVLTLISILSIGIFALHPKFAVFTFQQTPYLLVGLLGIITSLLFVLIKILATSMNTEAVKDKDERFKILIEKSTDVITLLSATGSILYSGPSAKAILGYELDENIGRNAFDFIHPADKKRTFEIFSRLILKPGNSVKTEYRVKHKNGDWLWMEGVGTNLLFEPNVRAIVVNYRDITERKESEKNLKDRDREISERNAKDEAILNSIGEGLIATDSHGYIVIVNNQGKLILNLDEEALRGKKLSEVIQILSEQKQPLPLEKLPINQALKTHRKITVKLTLAKKDKTFLPILATASPIKLAGEITGVVMIFRDITKEMEVDKAKTEFVSIASHQLRTPLTVIRWSMELIVTQYLNKTEGKLKEYLQKINLANMQMIELVDSLLDVSRIDIGTLAISPQPTNAPQIANEVIAELRPGFKNKKINFQMTVNSKLPLIQSDPKLLRIIIQNLLSNALKYTPPEGHVTFKMIRKESDIYIEVKDNGYGIPENQKTKIFSKLFRADNIQLKHTEGTGLGLYIAKSVVERLGGKIWFESKENKGSNFYVTLPIHGKLIKTGSKELKG